MSTEDVNCPYCNEPQEIDSDDGYGQEKIDKDKLDPLSLCFVESLAKQLAHELAVDQKRFEILMKKSTKESGEDGF